MRKKFLNILLIENNQPTAELIQSSFKTQSYRIKLVVARNLTESRDYLALCCPDLIIIGLPNSDFTTQDMNQIEHEFGNCPIILLVEKENMGPKVNSINTYIVDCLAKSTKTLTSLPYIIDSELYIWDIISKRKKVEKALRESEKELRIMNNISNMFIKYPGDEMYSSVLEIVIEETGSRLGIFGFIDQNGDWVCPSLTKDVWGMCVMPDKSLVIPKEKWGGIWGIALREKKTMMSNDVFNVPQGHVSIRRTLIVPIVFQGILIGAIMVGNKDEDYTEQDIAYLEKIAKSISPILDARLRQQEEKEKTEIAQEFLRESRKLLQNTLDSLIEGVFILDNKAESIIKCNLSALKILECTREEIVGKSVDAIRNMFLGQDEMERIAVKWDESRKSTDKIRDYECKVKRKDGTIFQAKIDVISLTDANGIQNGYVVVLRDMTEYKMMEMNLSQDQKLKSIGQLAAGIAHEINSPTQFISDNTRFLKDGFQSLSRLIEKYEMLTDKMKEDETYGEILNEIDTISEEIDLEFLKDDIPKAIEQAIDGLQRVSSIVHAMKDFAHPEIGEMVLSDLNRIVESTTTVSRNEWKYVCDVVLELDPNLPMVCCLPGEIGQVLLNMITNASHAIAGVNEDSPQKRGIIKISTHYDNEWAEIRVSDTGSGIPEEVRNRIFEPFFTTKDIGKGTGQGLAISRAVIVEKHGGTITFNTEEGKGTTFIIRLPLNRKGDVLRNKDEKENIDS